MLYRFLKFILSYAVRTYFREIQLRNDNRVPLSGPVIFLPNHRSAFMDPIVVAAYIKRRVHFLARGESFKNPVVAWILGKMNVIPIYRKDYSPDDMHKNEEIFKYCFQLLEQNGALVIFPEGASQTKPVLLPIKTGAARIAMGATAKNHFNLDVQLVPVGINYTNPHHFQGKLFLNFGRAIKTSEYKNEYEQDPIKAVQNLTGSIEEELRRRIVVMDDSRWQDLNEKVEQIVQSNAGLFFEDKKTLDDIAWFAARKDITAAIDYFKNEKPEVLEGLELRVLQYFSILDLLNLKEGTLNPLGKKREGRVKTIPLLLYFVLASPLFITGFILHYLPFLLTNLMAKIVVKRTDFIGSVTMVVGLIIFSINGFGLTYLVLKLSQSVLASLIFFFLLPASGIFAFQYYIRLRRWMYGWKIRSIGNRKASLMEKLTTEREALLEVFKLAHNDYLEYARGKFIN